MMRAKLATQAAETAVVVTGGLAASILAATFTEINIVLICTWGVAVIGDLLAGLWRVVVTEGIGAVNGRVFGRGMAKKIMFGFYWLAAALTDVLGSLIPSLGSAMLDITPTTKMVLAALICHEIMSITRNAGAATGNRTIGGLIRRALNARTEVQRGVEHGEADGYHVTTIDEYPDDREEGD